MTKTSLSCARGFPSVGRETVKTVPGFSDSCFFLRADLRLHSHWLSRRRFCQPSLNIEFAGTSGSVPVRWTIAYLSLDTGDLNLSSCKHHPHREQHPIPVAVRLHT